MKAYKLFKNYVMEDGRKKRIGERKKQKVRWFNVMQLKWIHDFVVIFSSLNTFLKLKKRITENPLYNVLSDVYIYKREENFNNYFSLSILMPKKFFFLCFFIIILSAIQRSNDINERKRAYKRHFKKPLMSISIMPQCTKMNILWGGCWCFFYLNKLIKYMQQ